MSEQEKQKKVIDAIERVAKQAARHDYEANLECGDVHSDYFRKYYDIHMSYLRAVSDIAQLLDSD